MGNIQTLERKRIMAYDVIRVVAIFAVIVIHAAAEYVDQSPYRSLEFVVSNTLDSIARMGVPLFIMLSGALMLDESKAISTKKVLHSTLRLYILLMFWSLVYAAVIYIVFPIIKPSLLWIPVSFSSFFNAFAVGHYHLWYLYMIIGLYLITPVLRLFVKKENKDSILYFLVIMVAAKSLLPFLRYFSGHLGSVGDWFSSHTERFDFSFMGEYLAFYVMGWYLANIEITKKMRVTIYCLGLAGVLTTILGTHFYSTESFKAYGFFYSYGQFNVLAASVAVFTFIFYAFKSCAQSKRTKPIERLSQLSFGIYLIHPLVLFLAGKLGKDVLQLPDRLCVRMFFELAITIVVSLGLTFILSKIPVLRKTIKA